MANYCVSPREVSAADADNISSSYWTSVVVMLLMPAGCQEVKRVFSFLDKHTLSSTLSSSASKEEESNCLSLMRERHSRCVRLKTPYNHV